MVHFSLDVTIHREERETKPFSGLKESATDWSTTLLVSSALRVTASSESRVVEGSSTSGSWAAVFVPSVLTEAGFLHNLQNDSICSVARVKQPRSKELSKNLLAMIHPFLADNFHIQAICCLRGTRHNPADILLLSLADVEPAVVGDLFDVTSCKTIHMAPESTLKVLMIGDISFSYERMVKLAPDVTSLSRQTFDIEQNIYQQNLNGKLLVRGTIKAAFLNADNMRPMRVPADIFEGSH